MFIFFVENVFRFGTYKFKSEYNDDDDVELVQIDTHSGVK